MCTTHLKKNSAFCTQTIFICIVWILRNIATVSLNSINWLVFVFQAVCSPCSKNSNLITQILGLKGLTRNIFMCTAAPNIRHNRLTQVTKSRFTRSCNNLYFMEHISPVQESCLTCSDKLSLFPLHLDLMMFWWLGPQYISLCLKIKYTYQWKCEQHFSYLLICLLALTVPLLLHWPNVRWEFFPNSSSEK